MTKNNRGDIKAVRHLVSLSDLSARQIEEVFRIARDMKAHPDRYRSCLRGKTVAMIFQKPSTRTRVSFETGIYQMGGSSLYLAPNDLQLGRGETIADTARVLSRYVNAIVARVFAQDDVAEMARSGSVPVINGLSDRSHPCQAVADYFTLLEKKKRLPGLKLAYVGDGNNVANSLIEGAAKLGVNISVACPEGYEPDPEVLGGARRAARKTHSKLEVVRKPSEAHGCVDFHGPGSGGTETAVSLPGVSGFGEPVRARQTERGLHALPSRTPWRRGFSGRHGLLGVHRV